jgi:hypothetical protein
MKGGGVWSRMQSPLVNEKGEERGAHLLQMTRVERGENERCHAADTSGNFLTEAS